MRHFAVVLLSLAVSGCAAPPLGAQEVAGTYSLKGETVVGAPYEGSITLKSVGQTFDVEWRRVTTLPRHGFALRLDNVLGVAVEDVDNDFGVVLYHVSGGHLEGIWQGNQRWDGPALGHENLDGPAGLDGNFVISLGINPDGSRYSGKVSIHKAGRMYSVNWYTPELRYVGTGVMVGDIFVVGYGAQNRSGVAAYCLQSGQIGEGITGLITDGGLGAEQFWPANAAEHPQVQLATLRDRDGTFGCGKPIVSLDPMQPALLAQRQ
jgi:hypothetical protein